MLGQGKPKNGRVGPVADRRKNTQEALARGVGQVISHWYRPPPEGALACRTCLKGVPALASQRLLCPIYRGSHAANASTLLLQWDGRRQLPVGSPLAPPFPDEPQAMRPNALLASAAYTYSLSLEKTRSYSNSHLVRQKYLVAVAHRAKFPRFVETNNARGYLGGRI
jgi:hypothetical protein